MVIPPATRGRRSAFEQVIVEIQFGEGGSDAKLFVADLADVYKRYAAICGLKTEQLAEDNGHAILKVSGRGAGAAFANEPGKHVVQRVPPTERSGRRQTSVISVAVLPLPPERQMLPLADRDIEVITQTGKQKAGGQNVNKVASAVRMKHKPTGIAVFINGRDQEQNRKDAMRILSARVNQIRLDADASRYGELRSNQMRGASSIGGRGDKVRTYNFIESRVVDHRLGTKTGNIKEVMKGNLGILFEQGE